MGAVEVSVCHVVNAANESSIPLDIARATGKRDGVTVTFVGLFDISESVRDADIDVIELASGDGIPARLRELRGILDGHDVVHVHHNHAGAYAKILGRLEGSTVVSTEHNDHRGFSRVGRIANGATNVLAHEVTCVSKAVHDSFRSWEDLLVPDKNVSVVHNGVPFEETDDVRSDPDIRAEYGINIDSVLVGHAAMLTRQKAQDVLIRALRDANARGGPTMELILTGDGDRRESLERLVSKLDLDEFVHFAGFVRHRRDVYRILAAVDIFSMPSRWEGFCVAVAEAMALERPCVLSDIDVFRELYGDVGVFHPVDDADALADRLWELATNTETRDRFGGAGRRYVSDRFRLSDVADEYVELYRDAHRGRRTD